MINCYDDFCVKLKEAGFSLASGGNDEGVFCLLKHGWDEELPDCAVRWFTGDRDTDPWEWRMRVLEERDDIAYSKLFFNKAGFITKEWYPYFLSARRAAMPFHEAYENGTLSHNARRIYDAVEKHGELPVEAIKREAGFSAKDKQAFARAITELQTRMFLTMSGRSRKRSQTGEEYGWASAVFCTVPTFFGQDIIEKAAAIGEKEAVEAIREQVFRLNPNAVLKKTMKFITG